MIQRKNITLSMNLKLNLKGILGPKIENKLVPGAPTSWCDAYVNPTPLIAFGTPNNSVKASLIEAGIPLNVCRDVRVKKL